MMNCVKYRVKAKCIPIKLAELSLLYNYIGSSPVDITHQQNSKVSEMITATRYFHFSFMEYSAAAVVPNTKALCIRRNIGESIYVLKY